MSKLNQEELLEELRVARSGTVSTAGMSEQAYQQIKEIIQNEPLPNTSWEKSQITMKEAKTMIASLSNEIARLGKKKPGITDEWIDEKAKEIVEEIGYRIEGEFLKVHIDRAKEFIRSLVEEIHGKEE